MTVYGICMVRDEDDIIGATVAHMLEQVDHVLVADNLSTDWTREVLESLSCPRLTVVDDDDPAYCQDEKMSRLAYEAMRGGADWVVPFDADEWWYSPHGRISDVLAYLGDYAIAEADLFDHVATAADPVEGSPVERIGWRRREPGPLPKVACRTSPDLHIEMGNHGAHYGAFHGRVITEQLVVRHFPYRSAEQMTRKALQGAAALEAAGMPRHVGQHWRDYADLERANPGAIADVFHEWFWSADPASDPSLIFDPAP